VAPYAVRARANAPVATPLRWQELADPDLRPDGVTIGDLADRLKRHGDPWAQLGRHARSLTGPRRELDRILAGRA
jgi:bifunctional non-homologous end joining protein LigD